MDTHKMNINVSIYIRRISFTNSFITQKQPYETENFYHTDRRGQQVLSDHDKFKTYRVMPIQWPQFPIYNTFLESN